MNGSAEQRAAFTLLEVLLVLVIIGLLAGMVAPTIFGIGERAHVDAARGEINSLYQACNFFRLGLNDYPSDLSQLLDGSSLGTKWAGPYIDAQPEDPWGHAYVYEYQGVGTLPNIFSVGPDGTAGTDDDVYKDEPQQ